MNAKRCPGCGRTGHTCWAAPCLYLQFVKSRPLGALIDWCNEVGGTLVSRQTPTGSARDVQSETP